MLSNNIYTISVGVVNVNGTEQRNTLSDASVLTSGLMSSNMVLYNLEFLLYFDVIKVNFDSRITHLLLNNLQTSIIFF